MNYELELSKLTPERKLELWQKVKDLQFSYKTKCRMLYYICIKEGFLQKK